VRNHSLDGQPSLLLDQPRGAAQVFDLAPALVVVDAGGISAGVVVSREQTMGAAWSSA
jgi:Ethanolamine utilization protein EutJ (predicted chaperonin)